MHHLHERGHHGRHLRRLLHQRVGGADGGSEVSLVGARAAAALGASLAGAGVAGGALAHELALGLGAGDGLLALPVALGGLAHGGAHGVGGLALSAAVGGGADGLALGAVLLLAQVLGAAHVALRLVAVNLALGALSLAARRRKEEERTMTMEEGAMKKRRKEIGKIKERSKRKKERKQGKAEQKIQVSDRGQGGEEKMRNSLHTCNGPWGIDCCCPSFLNRPFS